LRAMLSLMLKHHANSSLPELRWILRSFVHRSILSRSGASDKPGAIQTATSFYRKSYSNNLSTALRTLVKSGSLNELGGERYALVEEKASEIRSTLSGK
ncbi:MAG: hypothetical protein ACX93N_03185, partial [Pseudohaliea sp.]